MSHLRLDVGECAHQVVLPADAQCRCPFGPPPSCGEDVPPLLQEPTPLMGALDGSTGAGVGAGEGRGASTLRRLEKAGMRLGAAEPLVRGPEFGVHRCRTFTPGLYLVVVVAQRPEHFDPVIFSVSDVVAVSGNLRATFTIGISVSALVAIQPEALLAQLLPVRRQKGSTVRSFPAWHCTPLKRPPAT